MIPRSVYVAPWLVLKHHLRDGRMQLCRLFQALGDDIGISSICLALVTSVVKYENRHLARLGDRSLKKRIEKCGHSMFETPLAVLRPAMWARDRINLSNYPLYPIPPEDNVA